MQDNDAYTVPAYLGNPSGDSWYTLWAVLLEPYVKTIRVYFCPSQPVMIVDSAGNPNLLNVNNVGYGINFYYLTSNVPGVAEGCNHITLRETQIPRADRMIFLADSDWYWRKFLPGSHSIKSVEPTGAQA